MCSNNYFRFDLQKKIKIIMLIYEFLLLACAAEYHNRSPQNGGNLSVTSQYDVLIANSYFHDFHFSSDGESAISVTINSQYSMALHLNHTTFQGCSGYSRTLLNLNNLIRLNCNFICAYKITAETYGAILFLDSNYNSNGGRPHRLTFLTASHCEGGYHMVHIQDTIGSYSTLELKFTNISYGSVTYKDSEIPQYGLLQLMGVYQDTYANTFYNNKVEGCGLVLEYNKPNQGIRDFGIFHRCNFIENSANSNRGYIYVYCCKLSVNDCNFRNNYLSSYLMFVDQADVNAYDLTFETSKHQVFTGVSSTTSIGTTFNNNNLHSNTHFATRGFCAAEIPSYRGLSRKRTIRMNSVRSKFKLRYNFHG